ncbi:hypothetical protein Tco_0609300 [Tanacetum coccineum]
MPTPTTWAIAWIVKALAAFILPRDLFASWFAKKTKALSISTTEAEYVSAGKACQQALWMKQALIDCDIRLDDIPIMCDNKGAIKLSKTPYNTVELNI